MTLTFKKKLTVPDSATIAFQIVALINTPAHFSEDDGDFSYVNPIITTEPSLSYYM